MNRSPLNDQVFAATLPDGVVALDNNNRIIWWNEAAQRLLGLRAKSKGEAILSCLDCEPFRHYVEKNISGYSEEFSAPHDPALHLAVSLLPYSESGRILIVRDVTHTYHLEKMRQDFVANVSHELRTPLTVLRGYLESFMDNLPAEFKDRALIFTQMYQQSMRMERIIEDLLLLSRLETDLPTAEEQERIDMTTLLDHIREDAIALSGDRQHTISLKVSGPKFFYGKKTELRSAFSNLVFNAVHYTPAHGSIFMRWYRDHQGIHFEVEDTGIGIESKHISRLTERFYRVDPGRTRQTGGTGLGLAIVKHVLIRHQGQLHIESKVGKGSIFRCDFII